MLGRRAEFRSVWSRHSPCGVLRKSRYCPNNTHNWGRGTVERDSMPRCEISTLVDGDPKQTVVVEDALAGPALGAVIDSLRVLGQQSSEQRGPVRRTGVAIVVRLLSE